MDGNFTGSNYYTGVSMIHQKGDGYREHTQSEKTSLTWSTNLRLNDKKELSASVLFADMYYQTPGALTLKEFQANPRAARPKAGSFPSATDAKAAIFQKTFLTGFTFRNHLNQSLEHTTTVYSSFAQVKNPAIRNYERRNEPHFGGRTVLTLNKEWDHQKSLQWSSGIEFQQGYFNIMVSKNKGGSPDTLMANDDVNTMIYSLFTQSVFSVDQNWFFTTGISYNMSRLEFSRLTDYPVNKQMFSYKNELAPRVSVLKRISDFSILASVSKGFSPPTVAELLPSAGIINSGLEAEHGWNYELTAKQCYLKRKLNIEATGFYFNLNNAIVLQRDGAGADYFSNAGKIHQKGLELTADYAYLPVSKQALNYFLVNTSYAYNDFRYGNYVKENNDYSGKIVPSIPAHSLSLWSDILLVNGLYFKPSYYYASRIYLNDANTAAANPYHLLGLSVGYKKQFQKLKLKLYAGADNLLDEKYSLGNDINASGGRFYNAPR
ncbi:MAG: TonB-dependent receptor [Sphingobacteriales bacterium]|nr:TonB-dependent receptor [Sphingobacteriales bacterium]